MTTPLQEYKRHLAPFSTDKQTAKARPVKVEAKPRTPLKRGKPLATVGAKRRREAPDMRRWHAAVLERDGGLCQWCLVQGKRTPATYGDHLHPRATHPELRFELWNGAASCNPCNKAHNDGTLRAMATPSMQRLFLGRTYFTRTLAGAAPGAWQKGGDAPTETHEPTPAPRGEQRRGRISTQPKKEKTK